MPTTVYQDRPRRRTGDAFRRGAKQCLTSLDRTIGGSVAGRMPHEYNSSNQHNKRIDDDETPRTARAFASTDHILPNITRDMKKRQHKSFDPTKKKQQLASNKHLRENKENVSNHQQSSPPQPRIQKTPPQHVEGKCREEETTLATPTRLYVEDDGNEGTYEDPSEFDNAPDIHSPPMTPAAAQSPTLTAAHQWDARAHDGANEVGFESKYEEAPLDNATTPLKPPVSPLKSPNPNHKSYQQHQQHDHHHPQFHRSHRSHRSNADTTPNTPEHAFKESPEPETARASQFVSNRSPAAAMARLRRMKQERNTKQTSPLQRSSSVHSNHNNHNNHNTHGRAAGVESTHAEEAQHYPAYHHHHHHHTTHHSANATTQEEKYDEYQNNHVRSNATTVSDSPYEIIFSRARHGRLTEVQLALDEGMGVNSCDNHGNTLLHVACQNGNKKLAKMLLRRHADINATNKNGNTSLHFCFMYAYYGMAEYIMSKGADDTIRNKSNQTAYDVDA